MGAFGSMGTGAIFGIVLGCLVGVAFLAGFIKLYTNKQRLKKNTRIAEMEAAMKSTDKEKLVRRQKKPGEGDLFGVRALEHGYFGGVAQSRPSSPTPSYKLAPNTTLVDWGKAPRPGSSSSSLVDYRSSRNGSVSSLPMSTNQSKHKPSPLRLQPSDAELSGRINHDPASVGGIGGAYMPPLPAPRNNRSVTPCSDSGKPEGWVNPLDVHFTRPSTPVSPRPRSYLPKMTLPDESIKSALIVPTPDGSLAGPKSEQAPIVSSEASVPTPTPAPPPAETAPESPRKQSPTFSIFPQIPSRAARQSGRSIFPASDDQPRPPSRKSPKESKFDFNFPPVPLENLPPQMATIDPNQFPQDTRKWGPSSPIIRDSIVTKQRVSVYRPTRVVEQPQSATKPHHRSHSVAASSVYSTRTTIVDEPQDSGTNSRARSSSRDTVGRERSRSSHKRASSAHSLSRTQDSLRRHSRKLSTDTLRTDKRRSRQRDQMHFDPTQALRTRSGSVQGRAIDFDYPRESPFSNANAISTHSADSSISSTSSSSSLKLKAPHQEIEEDPIPQVPTLNIFNPPNPDRLSVATGRNRSASEASQGSIGDFYDSYYRQSILAQRQSVAVQANAINSGSSGLLMPGAAHGAGQGLGGSGVRRPAPAPLRLGPQSIGGGGLAGETIMEVASPMPSSGGKASGGNTERFPKMAFVGNQLI
ncbi:hypothetical protein L207DRAFT_203039 [Hyaloscypha variabilis F]|uniref:Uncharacterized protein n=1 Tax=Hyaloscypha variabilis (strain UAMH 11265 / GT02V1 / F) TaxID=1149755 RepID=A0A2J6QXA6_HYAVF|nr:hypothetical protein L207DRAFT_203039 [Hyaloscypha variabilis F]